MTHMFGDLFNVAIDIVTLPVKVATVVADEVFDSEATEVLEDIKDEIKID